VIKWILKFDFLFLHCNANPCDNSTIGRHVKALNFGVVWIVPREECNVHVPVLLVRSVLYIATGTVTGFPCVLLYFFHQWNWPPWYNLNLVERESYGISRHFQQYFGYVVAVSFIGGGDRSTWRKPPTCASYWHIFSLNVIPRWAGFEL
jgi:hypothetical protein